MPSSLASGFLSLFFFITTFIPNPSTICTSLATRHTLLFAFKIPYTDYTSSYPEADKMCYIWRCDADDFGHTGPLHVYLPHITPWNRIPFIFDESGNAHRIHHIRLNIRSSCPIICIDASNNRHSVSHIIIWRLDRPEATWGVFDNRYTPRTSDMPLFDPLLSYELPIISEQANALTQWYDAHENSRAIARGSGFASGRNENRDVTWITTNVSNTLRID